jgi:hypothetical protein
MILESVFGIIFLLLPGFVLNELIRPKQPLTVRIVISLGLSFSIYLWLGFMLSLNPMLGGITFENIVLFGGGISALLAIPLLLRLLIERRNFKRH